MDGQTAGWMEGQTNGQIDGWWNRLTVKRWTDGQVIGEMDEWSDGWPDGHTGERMD